MTGVHFKSEYVVLEFRAPPKRKLYPGAPLVTILFLKIVTEGYVSCVFLCIKKMERNLCAHLGNIPVRMKLPD